MIEGQPVTGAIRFVNTGKAPLQIDRVHASCGCTATQSEKMRIDPGDSTTIRYSIRTQGFRGIIRKSITVYFASPDVQPLQTIVEGTVFTEIEVSPSFIDFQSVPLRPDTTYKELILIQNSSDRPLQIKAVRATSKYLTVTPASATVDLRAGRSPCASACVRKRRSRRTRICGSKPIRPSSRRSACPSSST